MMQPMSVDPFAGLGKALADLRERAGFSTQTEASEALKIDKGQLSRWENEHPRPTLENLGRLLAGYGATVADLAAVLLGGEPASKSDVEEREELIRSLVEAVRRLEGRQAETEERLARLERILRGRDEGEGGN